MNYALYARTGAADYTQRSTGDFCPTATISGALTRTTTALTLTGGLDLDLVEIGGYAVINGEYVLVEALDADAGTALNKLALGTISILGSDPLRLLQGQASDASPIEKITSILKPEQKPSDPKS